MSRTLKRSPTGVLALSIQASTITSRVACAPAASVEVASGFHHQYARMV
jgi:hypothetical protein